MLNHPIARKKQRRLRRYMVAGLLWALVVALLVKLVFGDGVWLVAFVSVFSAGLMFGYRKIDREDHP
jgi:uncharacterized membrane protein YjjP (DUF1212 family)